MLVVLVRTGHGEDDGGGVDGENLTHRLDSVLLRHDDVHDRDGRPVLAVQAHPVAAIWCLEDAVALDSRAMRRTLRTEESSTSMIDGRCMLCCRKLLGATFHKLVEAICEGCVPSSVENILA